MFYYCAVVTPESVVFEDEVKAVIAPGSVGSFEVLANHAPIMASLKEGRVVVTTKDSQKMTFLISGGFLQMSHNQCLLLADTCEPSR